jgi:hypothetical protein
MRSRNNDSLIGSGLLAFTALVYGGCCPHYNAIVMIGDSPSQCANYFESGSHAPQHILACPGDSVIACWKTDAGEIVQVKLDSDIADLSATCPGPNCPAPSTAALGFKVGHLRRGSTGKVIFTFDFKKEQCRGINLDYQLDIPPPEGVTYRFDAGWTSPAQACLQSRFDLDPQFTSAQAIATDITAQWDPTFLISTATKSGSVTCKTPPFLHGNHPNDFYFFLINNPKITTPLTKHATPPPPHTTAVGEWSFDNKFGTPAQCAKDAGLTDTEIREATFTCDNNAILPYDLTVMCPR